MFTPTSTACPGCEKPLVCRRRTDPKRYWCATCRKDWSEDYLTACSRCTDLQVVMYSPNYIAIKPRRGTDDAWLIKTLFDKHDRRYSWIHGWMIRNLPKYAHLKVVQTATTALLKQYHFLELA